MSGGRTPNSIASNVPTESLTSFLLIDPTKKVSAIFLHGQFSSSRAILKAYNEALGMGVFATVNRTNGHARTAADITHLLAFYADFDVGVPDITSTPLRPSRRVQSSPGKEQWYWDLPDAVPCTPETVAEYLGILHALVKTLGADDNARDLARVLRVAGFRNTKYTDGPPVKTLLTDGPTYTVQQVKDAFGMIVAPQLETGSERTQAADEERAVAALYTAIRRNPPPQEAHSWNGWLYRLCTWSIGNLGLSAVRLEDELHTTLSGFTCEEITRTVANADRYAKRLKPAPLEIGL